MSSAPSLERQQSTDTTSSHDSYDFDADYDPFEHFEPPMKHVPRVKGHHPNRAATKIQSLLRGKKGRVRAATMRNAQTNEAMFNLADIESILKELEDCHSENDILKQQLVQRKEESKKQGGKRRRRKTRRKTRKKTHKKKSKSKRKTKRRRKSSKRRSH